MHWYSPLQSNFTYLYSTYLKYKLVQLCQINLQSQYFSSFFCRSVFQLFQVQEAGKIFIVYLFINHYLHLQGSKGVFFTFAFLILNTFFILKLLENLSIYLLFHFYFVSSSCHSNICIFLLEKYLIYLFSLSVAIILFQFEHLLLYNLWDNQ